MGRPSPDRSVALYEREELAAVTGGMLRPGGEELTVRAVGLCGLPPGAAVLDVGCGRGHTLALLASRFRLRPAGLDPNGSMLRRAAAKNPDVFLMQAQAGAIPLRDGVFDGLISECVLSLTGDITATLGEMGRILAPGGKLALTDIFVDDAEGHENCAAPAIRGCLAAARPLEAVTAAVAVAGFSILHLEDHSAALKQLAGQIIFDHGSLEAFWELFMEKEEAASACRTLGAARPGYYLLIAEKKEDQHG